MSIFEASSVHTCAAFKNCNNSTVFQYSYSREQLYVDVCTTYTVEPPNNGHSGDRPLVHCREVVPISEAVMHAIAWGPIVCPLYGGCPLLGCPLSEVPLYTVSHCKHNLWPQLI